MRLLKRYHLISLGINATVGSGIFLAPGILAKDLGPWSVVAFPLCGFLLSFVALVFAQLSTLTERNGGPYLYVDLAFGKNVAFLVGWLSWFCAMVSCGAVGSAIGFYLSHFLGTTPSDFVVKAIACFFILLFAAINYFGVTYGGTVMAWLTVFKLVPLVAIAVGGLFAVTTHSFPSGLPTIPWSQFSSPMLLALFACQGFEVVPIIAGETQHPTRIIPQAILFSLWGSVVLYAVIQLGMVVGPAVGSSKPLADQALFLWGKAGGDIVAATGVLSIIGFVAGIMLSAPRYLSPLCEDRLLPVTLSKEHLRFGTPSKAIFLTMIGCLLFTVINSIGELMTLAALSVVLQYLMSTLALFAVLWRRRAKSYWVVLLSLGVSIFFLYQVPRSSWLTLAWVMAVGYALRLGYQLWRRGRG